MVPTFLVTVEKLLDAPPSHCISLPQLSQLIGTISSQTQALSFSTKIPHLYQLATLDWGYRSVNHIEGTRQESNKLIREKETEIKSLILLPATIVVPYS